MLDTFGSSVGHVPGEVRSAKVTKASVPQSVLNPEKITLTRRERDAAVTTLLSRAPVDTIHSAHRMLDAVTEAVNKVRLNDPVGTLRKHPSGRKYAFAYAAGKYLLIDTDEVKPAYKTEDGLVENRQIRETWELVAWGSDAD